MESKNSSDMKKFFSHNVGKKCSICGRPLGGEFYQGKPLRLKCWKNELGARNNVKDIEGRLKAQGIL